MKFSDFKFESLLQEGLDSVRFETPTPIQQQAIPIILSGQDLIACAQTGTGKTAAFVLPILNKLTRNPTSETNTLIVVPTRELALQIEQSIEGFSYFTGVSSISIYGGRDGIAFESERRALTDGANIIIATPGRLMAHLNLGYVKFEGLKHFILDEADRMLNMGFIDDILKIASYLPKEKQTLMFSATMPPKIRDLAHKLLNKPEQINISVSKPAEGVKQGAFLVFDRQKIALVSHLLEDNAYGSVIIFVSTKQSAKELERELQRKKINAKAIHSDIEQAEREQLMNDFRSRKLPVLVATDILSRGIDIEDIGLVINYNVPGDAEDYIHRIGRTARAASKGTAYTFINDTEQGKFLRIENLIGSEVEKKPLPDGFDAGPEYAPEQRKPAYGKRKGGMGRNKGKFRKKPSGGTHGNNETKKPG